MANFHLNYERCSVTDKELLEVNFPRAEHIFLHRKEVQELTSIWECCRKPPEPIKTAEKVTRHVERKILKTEGATTKFECSCCEGMMRIVCGVGTMQPGTVTESKPCTCPLQLNHPKGEPHREWHPTQKAARASLVQHCTLTLKIPVVAVMARLPDGFERNANDPLTKKYSPTRTRYLAVLKLSDGKHLVHTVNVYSGNHRSDRGFKVPALSADDIKLRAHIPWRGRAPAMLPTPTISSVQSMDPTPVINELAGAAVADGQPSAVAQVLDKKPDTKPSVKDATASHGSDDDDDIPVCAICQENKAVFCLICPNPKCKGVLCQTCEAAWTLRRPKAFAMHDTRKSIFHTNER